ncbi:serine-rich adhesin for platelets-like [Dreissena polymorpha]|uniref:serine-rich adhesin for platelets-like n=1 Tax=Dreissena polymorpha TaxID=45954 RepID=UPI002263D722|nr:serine-rich adhesin for platelets-like [Dreissena polymorpha]
MGMLAPQDSFFNVVPGTAPTFAIWLKAGVKLDAATSPLLVNVQCVDDRSPANIITETFTVPLLDKPPTFVTGIPGTSPSISDSTVTATSLGVFTVTDPDTTCSITSSLTSVYEIRPVTSPADLQKPGMASFNNGLSLLNNKSFCGARLIKARYRKFQVWVSAAVTQASIDFNGQAVPLPLTITCTDGNTAITGTFNVNIVDEPPTFVSGMPGSSASISDATVTQTLLGKFTTTDPDTTCSVTSSVASAYEVRKVTSPANPQQPEYEVWIKITVTQASIDFNDQTVPLPLTIKCTDGYVANDITGTFNVNIVDEPPVITLLPSTGTSINDGLQAAAATVHTFNVTDSDDVVTCSTRAPQSTFFELVAATSPAFSIRVKAGVTLAAAVSPYVMNVDCTDAVTAVSSTFTQPVLDKSR